MIDPARETLLSLSEASRSLPIRRAGKRPHVSCIYRWTSSGCKGVILESIQIGGTRCTSREALARFFEQLTQAAGRCPPETPRTDDGLKRAKEFGAALEKLGC